MNELLPSDGLRKCCGHTPIFHKFTGLNSFAVECAVNGHIHNTGFCDSELKARVLWNALSRFESSKNDSADDAELDKSYQLAKEDTIHILPAEWASKLIDSGYGNGNYRLKGLFIRKEGDMYVGLDNSTGNCRVEEFKSFEACVRWLRHKSVS